MIGLPQLTSCFHLAAFEEQPSIWVSISKLARALNWCCLFDQCQIRPRFMASKPCRLCRWEVTVGSHRRLAILHRTVNHTTPNLPPLRITRWLPLRISLDAEGQRSAKVPVFSTNQGSRRSENTTPTNPSPLLPQGDHFPESGPACDLPRISHTPPLRRPGKSNSHCHPCNSSIMNPAAAVSWWGGGRLNEDSRFSFPPKQVPPSPKRRLSSLPWSKARWTTRKP